MQKLFDASRSICSSGFQLAVGQNLNGYLFGDEKTTLRFDSFQMVLAAHWGIGVLTHSQLVIVGTALLWGSIPS